MHFLSSTKNGKNVREALEKVTSELNEELSEVPGSIVGFDSDINLGLSGAEVRIIVVVDGRKIRSKKILWANKGGSSQDEALNYAKEDVNSKIEDLSGEIADYHVKFISPPISRRAFVTILVGINEELPEEIEKLSTEERRARIRKILNLLGGEAKTINVTKMAEAFGVTREIIYKDIEKLGFER